MNEDAQNSVESWIRKQNEIDALVQFSVVIPAYNEEWRLPPTLIDIIDYFDERKVTYEIIVVDDGSSDQTVAVVDKFVKIRTQVKLIRLPRNYGKGHAVRTGMLNARGEFILFSDADGSTAISQIERLEAALHAGKASIAFGSRAAPSASTRVQSRWYRKALGRCFNFFVSKLLLPGVLDTQCGFKLFTRDAAQFVFSTQECDGFGFDLEILYLAKRADIAFEEVPVNWVHVPGSKVNLIIDALKMFRDIFVFRFRHRSVSPSDFSSPAVETCPST